jgi:hypothetical protein
MLHAGTMPIHDQTTGCTSILLHKEGVAPGTVHADADWSCSCCATERLACNIASCRKPQDYFEFEAGNAQTGRARGLSAESQQAIAQWLKENEDVTFPAQRRQQEQEQP